MTINAWLHKLAANSMLAHASHDSFVRKHFIVCSLKFIIAVQNHFDNTTTMRVFFPVHYSK